MGRWWNRGGVVGFLAGLLVCPGLAQSAGFFSPTHPALYFKDDGTLVEFIRSDGQWMAIEERIGAKPRRLAFNIPPDVADRDAGIQSVVWFRRQYWLLSKPAPGGIQSLYSSRDLRHWDAEGRLDLGGIARASLVVPYKESGFLVVLKGAPVWGKQGRTKLLVARKAGADLKPEEALPILFDGRSILENKSGQGMRGTHYALLGLVDALLSQPPVLCGDYLLLASKERGVFWIVDTVKGQLRQKNLFPGLNLEHVRDNITLNPVIANLCPAPNGTVLVASRPRKAALDRFTSTPNLGPEALRNAYKTWSLEHLSRYPDLEWWRLDPSDASVTPVGPPAGNLPGALSTPAKWASFRFKVHPDERCTLAQ